MIVQVWSDIVCPWCYVGKRRFERGLERFPQRDRVEVVYRSFQLNPDAPAGQTSDRQEMLRRKYRLTQEQEEALDARMVETAKAEGLDYHPSGRRTGCCTSRSTSGSRTPRSNASIARTSPNSGRFSGASRSPSSAPRRDWILRRRERRSRAIAMPIASRRIWRRRERSGSAASPF